MFHEIIADGPLNKALAPRLVIQTSRGIARLAIAQGMTERLFVPEPTAALPESSFPSVFRIESYPASVRELPTSVRPTATFLLSLVSNNLAIITSRMDSQASGFVEIGPVAVDGRRVGVELYDTNSRQPDWELAHRHMARIQGAENVWGVSNQGEIEDLFRNMVNGLPVVEAPAEAA